MIKLDDGIDIPPGRRDQQKYPFKFMKVGDSFASNGPKDSRVHSAAWHYAKKHFERTGERIKFRVRSNAVETRCWRVE